MELRLLAGSRGAYLLASLADSGEAEGRGQAGLLPWWKPLHEVHVLLVGQCVGAAARSASFGEAHVPARVARRHQGCVVVL